MKTTNRRNLFILVFALLVAMLGFGKVMPVFPFLIDKQFGWFQPQSIDRRVLSVGETRETK